jgi:hypothetical protein
MSIFRFLSRPQSTSRRTVGTCLNCDTLENRTVMTGSTFSNAMLGNESVFQPVLANQANITHMLGTPEPTQGSPYAGLKAPSSAPQVFQDAANARSQSGLDGTGLTVAFIDTGVDYSLNALGAGYGPNSKVIAGYDFGMNDSDPMPTWNHGTSVASVVGSTDPANPGIAPGADIVALRVFDDAGNSTFFRIADALEWVVANHSKFNISVVNISLSDSSNSSLNWFAHDTSAGQRITEAVSTLRSMKIAVVSAAGNSFNGTQGMGFTAIVKDTISVTGVDPSTGQLASNAQRLGASVAGAYATDIAAPSSGFRVITGNGQYETVDGTSFAAPVVSGSILLLQQKYMMAFGSLPTVDQVESWLKQSGDPTSDPVTGLSIPQIDLAQALAAIPTSPQNPLRPVATVAPIVPLQVIANNAIQSSPAKGPSPASPPALRVRVNGRLVAAAVQSGNVNLESLQVGAKWNSADIWTGQAIANQSTAASRSVAVTGRTQKVMNLKQNVQERRATRLARISAIHKKPLS